MKRLWRDNGLSIVLVALFLSFWIGQALTGWRDEVAEHLAHHDSPPTLVQYLRSASFFEATAENWQSEFLAIGSMVVLTIFLRQRGSPESKPVDSPHRQTGA